MNASNLKCAAFAEAARYADTLNVEMQGRMALAYVANWIGMQDEDTNPAAVLATAAAAIQAIQIAFCK